MSKYEKIKYNPIKLVYNKKIIKNKKRISANRLKLLKFKKD